MKMRQRCIPFLLFIISTLFLIQCKNSGNKVPEKDIVANPAKLSERTAEDIRSTLLYLKENNGKLNDSVNFSYTSLVDSVYSANNYQAKWFKEDQTLPSGDSLLNFIQNCRLSGLFPGDYHEHLLSFIHGHFRSTVMPGRMQPYGPEQIS